jgi:hypothetical protein
MRFRDLKIIRIINRVKIKLQMIAKIFSGFSKNAKTFKKNHSR